ncbi:MAG: stage II sporulation protein M [Candidatus Diapherotrites archaeon]|nr:stage II sporulation protein M [Candidatus Diapherotrites archaeon]
MIESLLRPDVVKKRPYEMFFLAVVIGIVAVWTATLVGGPAEVGHLGVAFACIAMTPILVRIFQMEEEKDEHEFRGSFVVRHGAAIEAYGYYFVGLIVSISLVYALLPASSAQTMFEPQVHELTVIQSMSTGRVASTCGFFCLLENNLGVLALTILFSFVFGAGAIYILTWNASIVGVLIGMMTKNAGGTSMITDYLIALPTSLIALMPHGIFEIGAYLFGGLAGGMLSACMIRGHLPKKEVIRDIATIALFSILLVAIGAVIEAG